MLSSSLLPKSLSLPQPINSLRLAHVFDLVLDQQAGPRSKSASYSIASWPHFLAGQKGRPQAWYRTGGPHSVRRRHTRPSICNQDRGNDASFLAVDVVWRWRRGEQQLPRTTCYPGRCLMQNPRSVPAGELGAERTRRAELKELILPATRSPARPARLRALF